MENIKLRVELTKEGAVVIEGEGSTEELSNVCCHLMTITAYSISQTMNITKLESLLLLINSVMSKDLDVQDSVQIIKKDGEDK